MYIPVRQKFVGRQSVITWHLLAMIIYLYRPSVLQPRNQNRINLCTGKNWHIQEHNQTRLECNVLEFDFITTCYVLRLILSSSSSSSSSSQPSYIIINKIHFYCDVMICRITGRKFLRQTFLWSVRYVIVGNIICFIELPLHKLL